MEYLRISDNKLKITMTEEELLFYGMDLSSLSYSSTETRRAFWAILDDAKHATGFDAAASKVSVQIYACRSGGCEMYIIGEKSPSASKTDAILHASQPLPSNTESGLTVCPSYSRQFGEMVGKFARLSDLLSACRILSQIGYNDDSSAWLANEHYYLYISGNYKQIASNESNLGASGVILEFGEAEKNLTAAYFAEHGRCLCNHHAVEQLGKMIE